jgi:hypothetical protein
MWETLTYVKVAVYRAGHCACCQNLPEGCGFPRYGDNKVQLHLRTRGERERERERERARAFQRYTYQAFRVRFRANHTSRPIDRFYIIRRPSFVSANAFATQLPRPQDSAYHRGYVFIGVCDAERGVDKGCTGFGGYPDSAPYDKVTRGETIS